MTPTTGARDEAADTSSLDDQECLIVLFVDDEESVLAGLRTALHRLRRTHRCLFAEGAEEALAILAAQPVDVVVTDMRMSRTGGLELLRRIQRTHPSVIRYVLSGEAEKSLVLGATSVVHRWLSKPCDREELVAALAMAIRHRVLILDPDVRAALTSTITMRTRPDLRRDLEILLADPQVSEAQAASLVESDAAISAKVLQLANSVYSTGRAVVDVRSAIGFIGLPAVIQVVSLMDGETPTGREVAVPGFEPAVLAEHVSVVSRLASRLTHPDNAELCRVGGLLTGIGLLVEVDHLPDRLAEAYAHAEASDCTLVEAERQLFGVTHPQVAGHLLSLWGLPPQLVELVASSHQFPSLQGTVPLEPIEAVRVARLLAQSADHTGQVGAPHVDRLHGELLSAVRRWQTAAEPEKADR